MGEHDVELTRRDDAGTSFGYMLDWGEDAPMRVSSEPPNLPVSTSTGVAESGGAYSGRDAAPPYPIEVNNWQDGAGQASYDQADASPDAFAASKNIDCSDAGHIELGPRSFAYAYSTAGDEIGNVATHALGTFWSSFVPAAADPRNSVRYLVRFPVIAGSVAGEYLDTGSTGFVLTDATALDDITGAVADPSVAVGDFLYCPVHNEVVLVTDISAQPTLVVTRASCGTTEAVHTAGERWYAFGWRSVTFADGTIVDPDDPTTPVTAFCTDGGKLYASFYSGSGADGSIWMGTAGTSWTRFGEIAQVKAMAYCAGYLYCAQDGVSSTSQVTAVEDDGTTTHVLTAVGGLAPNTTTAGLVTLGNYVYWAVTDGYAHSWVYRLQYSATATTFELVAKLPDGFVASSIVEALSQVYVGGYMDTFVTDADNAGDERYHGYLYAIISGSEVAVACKWTDSTNDYRIKALTVGGPLIYMLTPNDVRAYSVEHGGWWHVADVLTNSTTLAGYEPDWTTTGFTYPPTGTLKKPSEASAIYTDVAAWEDGVSGFAAVANVVGDGAAGTVLTSSADADGYHMSVNSAHWYRWTLDSLPSGGVGTMEASFSEPFSQAGAICMSGANAEAQVQIRGFTSGGSRYCKVGLRYCASGGAAYLGTRWTDSIPADGIPAVYLRLTMDTVSGAKVYVNGSLALTATYDELLRVTGAGATKVWFACGWPGDSQTDTNAETILWGYVRFTGDGAFAPDYQPVATTVTTKSIAFGEGRLLVPAPDLVASYIEPKENSGSGWLQTSTSSLHMGTVEKYFTSVDVIHSPLQGGQTLIISPYVDGVSTGSTSVTGPSSDVGSTTSTATVNSAGKRIHVVVTLQDTDNDRRREDRLRVTSITGRFFPANSARLHTFILNCRRNVQTRHGSTWARNPDAAIRHAFAIAESGEVVDVKCLWGDFSGRVEDLSLSGSPADRSRYDAMSGVLKMKVRSVA